MRRKIWDFAAIDEPPKCVSVTNVGQCRGQRHWWDSRKFAYTTAYKAKAAYKIPDVLHVNFESRLRAKKFLRTAFFTFLNNSRDLGNTSVADETFQNVRNVVIKSSKKWYDWHYNFYLQDFHASSL
jgi:hypothetical protein